MFLILILPLFVLADECSEVLDLTRCLDKSPYCFIVYAGQLYQSPENPEGIVLNTVNDLCRSLNFFTSCKFLSLQTQCQLSSCLWDPATEICYEWAEAPCQAYSANICQWNSICEVIPLQLSLPLDYNYTTLNSVDDNQQNGRKVGTWLYDFGVIRQVLAATSTQETYIFDKCIPKALCELILTKKECFESELECYYNPMTQVCEALSAKADCSQLTLKRSCEADSVPCIWLNEKCYRFSDSQVACSQLGANCLLNEKCYFDGKTCRNYLGCSDFRSKQDCEATTQYNCFFDSYFNLCKPITQLTRCKDISARNCGITQICEWNLSINTCEFINPDFYCTQKLKPLCSGNCEWNTNISLCQWRSERSKNCGANPRATCDSAPSKDCYFDSIQSRCVAIQHFTLCQSQGPLSCGKNPFSKCIYVGGQCISLYQAACEDLSPATCIYGSNCYLDVVCKSLHQCSDNQDQIEACHDDPLNCYFDFEGRQCRRVTIATSCSKIFRQNTCSLALCAWKNGVCIDLSLVSCSQLTNDRCNFSSSCYFMQGECRPYQACAINDGNMDKCNIDINHCFFDSESDKCRAITGETACSSIVGAANCNFASCVLQPGKTQLLECVEFSSADCAYLKENFCHFGQCRWNSTSKSCKIYPEPIIVNATTPNKTSTENNQKSTSFENQAGEQNSNQDLITSLLILGLIIQ